MHSVKQTLMQVIMRRVRFKTLFFCLEPENKFR
nr:MAG TPA_asm: hypothetical protein [Caudoviricetes sp.]